MAVVTLGKKDTHIHTQWTLILKYLCLWQRLIESRGRDVCVCVVHDRLPTHPFWWPRRLLLQDIRSMPLHFLPVPPPLLLLCMHISHSHGITRTASPGQHIHTYTQIHTKQACTILPHQWSMDARQRKRGRCIHSLSIVSGSSVSPVNRRGSAL